ncbi:MAG: DUF3828 domain-containing protein [bacterium]|nr:DUF3828 domain-containing protein [bacterium]
MIAAIVLAATMAAAPPVADRSTPASTARTFYAWHLHHNVFDGSTAMRSFLTPELANGFAWVDAAQACTHSAILDYDPFGGGQVGITAYAVGATTMHEHEARVTMHLKLWKNEPSTATLVMQRGKDGWRIADALDDRGTSVAHELKRDRAESAHYTKLTNAERSCLAKIPY